MAEGEEFVRQTVDSLSAYGPQVEMKSHGVKQTLLHTSSEMNWFIYE